MRVAYVCADVGVPVFGSKGCSVHVQEVVRSLVRRGATVDLFTTRAGGEPPGDLAGVRVHQLSVSTTSDPADWEQAALTANSALSAELEKTGPFEMVYERYSLWSYAAMEYAQSFDTPGVLEVNAPLILEQARHRRLVHREEAEKVSDRVFGAATSIIAISDEVARYLADCTGRAECVHVVSNGVNTDRFTHDVSPALPNAAADFTVGFAGTLKPWHGLSVLIEAFEILHREDPDVGLLIVGDGPERKSIEHELEARGLRDSSRVQLTGAVDPARMPGLLTSMSVGVAPYPGLEDFYFSPIKIFEYMAAGLPVVASRIGSISQLIEDGYNGLLCRPGDPAMLADALVRLRDDQPLRNRLGTTARQTVVANHTWDSVVERIFELAGCDAASHAADWERVT